MGDNRRSTDVHHHHPVGFFGIPALDIHHLRDVATKADSGGDLVPVVPQYLRQAAHNLQPHLGWADIEPVPKSVTDPLVVRHLIDQGWGRQLQMDLPHERSRPSLSIV